MLGASGSNSRQAQRELLGRAVDEKSDIRAKAKEEGDNGYLWLPRTTVASLTV